MTSQEQVHKETATPVSLLPVDAAREYPAFTSWWLRTVGDPVPGPMSYYFDTWMASARCDRGAA